MSISVEKVKLELNRIKLLGFVENVKSDDNDGAIGNTFEHYLGVKENNLKDADFEGWEIKTKKQYSKTATTLFSKKPSFPEKGDRYMLNKFGEADEDFPNCTNLNTTIYCNKIKQYYNNYFYQLELKEDQINLIVKDKNKKIFDNKVYWKFEHLIAGSKKLKNTIIVTAKKEIFKNKINFKYISFTALINFKFENLIDAFKNGRVVYEHRWSPDKTGDNKGKDHNHGGGFRVRRKEDLEKLFESKVEI
tara:strand:+ start:52 stop:795 length:744 start_codon:yes stop_codon:yes gene_type:complete